MIQRGPDIQPNRSKLHRPIFRMIMVNLHFRASMSTTALLMSFLACLLLIACIEMTDTEPPSYIKNESIDSYLVQYEWNYRGWRWEINFRIPKSHYLYFKDKIRTGSYGDYVLNPVDDVSIAEIAQELSDEARSKGWGEAETISFVLSFVQSMPYTSDSVTTGYDEYPRYPVETLVDGGGDCEDTSILFASLVKEIGYGVVLLELTKDYHMAVGVRVSPDMVENWQGHYPLTYYTANDNRFYAYCETTGWGWEIGEKSKEMVSQTARIIELS